MRLFYFIPRKDTLLPTYQVTLTNLLMRLLRTEGITEDEFRKAKAEVMRIAALDDPKTDPTLLRIRLTNEVWHRQRREGETFRTILYIDDQERKISIIAVMRRDDNTYRRVYLIFKRWDP
jgi:hypothetical protein